MIRMNNNWLWINKTPHYISKVRVDNPLAKWGPPAGNEEIGGIRCQSLGHHGLTRVAINKIRHLNTMGTAARPTLGPEIGRYRLAIKTLRIRQPVRAADS